MFGFIQPVCWPIFWR